MVKQTIWLDLRDFDTDRATIRRLVKNLKKSPEFERHSERVLFFQVDPLTKAYFFEAIGKAIRSLGYESRIMHLSERELLSKEGN